MMKILVFAAFLLVSQPCTSRSVKDEDSVVSVYTTLPTKDGQSGSLDVYQQIAGNIVEKITSPILRLFGVNSTEEKTTKRPFERVELPKNQAKTNKTEDGSQRDVEELSDDFARKTNGKPEKFTLFSSYLPSKLNYVKNDSFELDDVFNSLSSNGIDSDSKADSDSNKADSDIDDFDSFEDDNDSVHSPRGPFVYFLELFASIFQLLYGGFQSLFSKPSESE